MAAAKALEATVEVDWEGVALAAAALAAAALEAAEMEGAAWVVADRVEVAEVEAGKGAAVWAEAA